MTQKLKEKCRALLESGDVKVVVGYGQDLGAERPHPVFITQAADVDRLVLPEKFTPNLAIYLTRPEVKLLGRPAIVVSDKGARAATVLMVETQVKREDVVLLGVVTGGEDDASLPALCDEVFGDAPAETPDAKARYARLAEFMEKSREERMEYWQTQLKRCIKCYACRQICPLCYCNRCIVDKNRPTEISTSATLEGNFAWHIVRAFHLAGRCVGCGECTATCPAGIDLELLNLSLARAAEDQFGYRSGIDAEAAPIIGSFSEGDQETFIG